MRPLKLTDEEQNLFVLLFIHLHNREKRGKGREVDKELLLTFVPDMRYDAPRDVDEAYMDEVLDGFLSEGYLEEELYGGKLCYEISDKGIDYLKEEDLWLSSEKNSPHLEEILDYLPHQALGTFFESLSKSLEAQVGVMNQNVKLFFTPPSGEVVGVCDECIRYASEVSCTCSDLLAVRRAKEKGVHCYRCHAGFVKCVAPFAFSLGDGETEYGFVFLGRIIDEDLDVDRLINYCRSRGMFLGKKLPDEEGIRRRIESERQSERDIEKIEGIASGIAEFLSDLAEEISTYRSKINMLSDVIEVGSGILEPKDILKNVMRPMQKVFNCDGATIWKMSSDQETLVPIDSHNGLVSIADEPLSVSTRDKNGFISWIAREHSPLLVNDVPAHIRSGIDPRPKYPDYMKQRKLEAFLGVPVVAEDKFAGVFEIERHEKGQFTVLDQELLVTVAHIAGLVIRRFQLLEVLSEVSRKRNLSELLAAATQRMPELLSAEYCSIFLFDSYEEKLFLRATGSSELLSKINKAYYDKEETGLTWRVFTTGRTIMMSNTRRSPYWTGRHQEVKSIVYLGCPLRNNLGEVQGVIRFTTKDDNFPFNNQDKRLAEILSNWLSLAIDRMHLGRARENYRLLLEIVDIQNTASTIGKMLDRIAEKVTEISAFNCRGCEISILDEENGGLRVRGAYRERKGGVYREGDNSFVGLVAAERGIIRCRDIRDFYKARGWPKPKRSGSRLGIPLMVDEELIGVIKLTNKNGSADNPAKVFTDDDEAAGRIIAAGIAKIIKEYQERANVSSVLAEVDRQYMEKRDAMSAISYLLNNLDRAIDGSWGCIYQHDVGKKSFVCIGYSTKAGRPPKETKIGHVKIAIDSKEPLYIDDARNDKEHIEILNTEDFGGGIEAEEVYKYVGSIGSEYVVPMRVAGRPYGAFHFYQEEKDAFTIYDKQAAEDLSARASLLLESHELLEARRKLYDTSLQLQEKMDINQPSRMAELQNSIVASVAKLGYDRARLYIISQDGKRIESVTQVGLSDQQKSESFRKHDILSQLSGGEPTMQLRKSRVTMDVGIVTHVLELGKPLIYIRSGSDSEKTIGQRDVEEDQLCICPKAHLHDEELEKSDVDEWLDIPLIAAGRQLGKLTVDNKWSKKPFSRLDCETLGLFGRYASEIILNALEIEKTVGFGLGARALAHNIKNKIAAGNMLFDLIEETQLPSGTLDYIKLLRLSYQGALRSVDAMRKTADIESTNLEALTIEELLNVVLKELRLLEYNEKNLRIDIPPGISDRKVKVDRDQIVEVFTNLMLNSQEAGGKGVEISVSAELEGGRYIRIYWEDNGPGIPEQVTDRLFLMGYTTKPGGTGTGLFSVRRMLLNNGGDIWFDKSKRKSNGNYAAQFVMRIPLLDNSEVDGDGGGLYEANL